jgi:hypothetical protein
MLPFVEGIPQLPAILSASDIALPVDLNIASTIWWTFEPY